MVLHEKKGFTVITTAAFQSFLSVLISASGARNNRFCFASHATWFRRCGPPKQWTLLLKCHKPRGHRCVRRLLERRGNHLHKDHGGIEEVFFLSPYVSRVTFQAPRIRAPLRFPFNRAVTAPFLGCGEWTGRRHWETARMHSKTHKDLLRSSSPMFHAQKHS